MRMRSSPLARRFRRLLIAFSAASISLMSIFFLGMDYWSARQLLGKQLQSSASLLAANSSAAVAFGDDFVARDMLEGLSVIPQIERACLYAEYEDALRLFARFTPNSGTCEQRWLGDVDHDPAPRFELGRLVTVAPVLVGAQRVGVLVLERTLEDLFRELAGKSGLFLLIVLGGIGASIWVAAMIQRQTVAPILELAQTARMISEKRDYGQRAAVPGYADELATLVNDFNAMLGQIQDREAMLQKANQRLEKEIIERAEANEQLRRARTEAETALVEVRLTQEQLIEAEKMASLGGLVAGVAHEINNPIGVGVTAASQLAEDIASVKAAMSAGSLKRSELASALDRATELSTVTLSHLQRAAELVASFKQVAVDRSSDVRRQLDLGQYLRELAVSLQPQLKQAQVRFKLELQDEVMVTIAPGVVAQVVTNLVINALRHAFADPVPKHACIGVSLASDEQKSVIAVEDNGCGMPPEVINKIFDPFFTTKRGEGGSGLGMHLVYNLVRQNLDGQIDVQSSPGRGTRISVTIPRTENNRVDVL